MAGVGMSDLSCGRIVIVVDRRGVKGKSKEERKEIRGGGEEGERNESTRQACAFKTLQERRG